MTDTTWMDATAQSELVRSGQASPSELVADAIARIERVDPQLNAVVHDRFDAARAEAAGKLPDGPEEQAEQAWMDGDKGYRSALLSTLERTRALLAEGRL